MACNNQNTGLMTELVYKVKKLACDVRKLNLEDTYLQEQIDKLAILIGEEGLKGYDTIMEVFANIESKMDDILNTTSGIIPDYELDADKYLYNDGTTMFWREVPEVDLSSVYELIYSYHPFEFGVTLKIKGTTVYETGSVVNPTLTWQCSSPATSLTISDGTNVKSPEKGIDGNYEVSGEIVFDGNYTETTEFFLKATGKNLKKDDGEELSDNSKAVLTIKDFAYIVRIQTDTFMDADGFWKVFSWTSPDIEFIGVKQTFDSFEYTPGNTKKKYQYFVLMPTSFKKSGIEIAFSFSEPMLSLGEKTIKNKHNADVKYEVLSSNNLVDDIPGKKFSIK